MPPNPIQSDPERVSPVSRFSRWWATNWNHPAMAVVYLVIVTQAVKEFYPLSEFAMYSNPTDEPTRYLFLVDADRYDRDGTLAPVAMEHTTGFRAAKAKKIFNSKLGDHADALGVKKENLDPVETEKAGSYLLSFLRERSVASGRSEKLPARLALVEGRIEIGQRGLTETREVIAAEP